MRALGSRVTAATCLLLASGCWYRLGVGHGSLVLSWSFNGGENCATTGVTQLEVSGAGLTTTLDCADADGNDFANGTLPKVPAGTQTFLLTGIGPVYDPAAGVTQPKAIYRGTVTFDISEDSVNTPAPVDLIPLEPGAQGGDLLLLWTFGGQSCETAGVSQVGIVQSGTALLSDTGFTDTDRGADLLVPCRANGQQGARILGLPRNLYSLPLYANDDRLPTTFDPYVAAPTAYVTGSTETVLHVDLHAASSEQPLEQGRVDLTLRVDLPNGADCSNTGVDTVRIQLFRTDVIGAGPNIDGTPQPVVAETYPTQIYSLPCTLVLSGDINISTNVNQHQPEPNCAITGTSNSVCPISAGEYHLMVQGLSAGQPTFMLSNYDLWIDQGLAHGAIAGVVPGYDVFPFGGPWPNVDSAYALELSPAPLAQ